MAIDKQHLVFGHILVVRILFDILLAPLVVDILLHILLIASLVGLEILLALASILAWVISTLCCILLAYLP